MRSLIYYIERWNGTNTLYLLKNLASSAGVFWLTCTTVKHGVFKFYDPTKACIFAILLCCLWSGVFNSIALFYSEKDYIIDDLKKFLTVRVYIIANVIIQTFLCIAEAAICSVIFLLCYDYDATGIVFSNSSIDYFITFFLILISSDMLGILVGMLVKSITSAMTIIPIILITQFLFSGCLFSLNHKMQQAAKFTVAKWGYSALGTITNLNLYLKAENRKVKEIFTYTSANVIKCWYILFLLGIVCLLGAGLLLNHRINKDSI